MTRWQALAVVCGIACGSVAAAGDPQVALDTSLGRIVVELDPSHAPITANNFLGYVADGHYDGTVIHRVVDGFVIQGGGLTPDMKEKPTRPAIVNEAGNGLSNRAGTIAMAREEAIDSATAQWFINVADNPRLDHLDVPPEGVTIMRRGQPTFVSHADANGVFGYAVFGRVVDGMDVVERIRHVAVHTIPAGDVDANGYENVPIEPIVIRKAALLPTTP